jgi:hypothetical protein
MKENSVLKLCREIVEKKRHRLAFLEKIEFPVNPVEIYNAFNCWKPEDGQIMLMIEHETNFECYTGDVRGNDVPKVKVVRQGDKVTITLCEDGTTIECSLALISFDNYKLYTPKPSEGEK